MSGRRRTILRAAVTVATIALTSADTLARAGGGGGFHGGGGGGGFHGGGGGFHSGGGGDGDGGALFYLLFQLIRFGIFHPVFGIPMLIVAIVIVVAISRQGGNAYQNSVIRRGNSLLDRQAQLLLIERLQQTDSTFDEDAFYQRVSNAFLKIQDAWAHQNLQAVRPFISDGVLERFNLQFDEQKALGYRNAMDNVTVQRVAIAAMQSDNLFDQLSVRIEASANDFKVSLADGSKLAGSDDSGAFVEVWSFLRRRGVQTSVGKTGLIEGNCPNCGAAVEMNQNANCAHCGAMLRSGQYDWVLAEITQESEWAASQRTEMAGVRDMIARDPDFNLQDLEDRASVVFWRRTAAERTGDVRPMRKIATADFCRDYARDLKAHSASAREYYGECAVGSVDTLGLISDDTWDRAMIEVRWAGTMFVASSNEPRPRKTDRTTLTRMVLDLGRRAGVKTNASQAISSSHCPNCGAPESGRDDSMTGACEFCGAVLNDGTRRWVLMRIITPAEAQQLLGPMREPISAATNQPAPTPRSAASTVPSAQLLAWMIQMALADGTIDPTESDMLANFAQRRNISRATLDGMIQAGRQGTVDLPTPSRGAEAQEWLESMARAALADGKMTREESALLQSAGQRAGLNEWDTQMLIKRARGDVYTAAQQALRQSRRGSNLRPNQQ